jgi:hypothetical protein
MCGYGYGYVAGQSLSACFSPIGSFSAVHPLDRHHSFSGDTIFSWIGLVLPTMFRIEADMDIVLV